MDFDPSASLRIEPLDKKRHHRTAFECGVAELDNYLKRQANQDKEKGKAVPFVLTDGTGAIWGYSSLSSSEIVTSSLPEMVAKKLPDIMPVTLLGRLAVDGKPRGKGLGEILLIDALKRSYEVSKSVGSYAVVVDAKGDRARDFYLKYGFIPFEDDLYRLFMPMKTIQDL